MGFWCIESVCSISHLIYWVVAHCNLVQAVINGFLAWTCQNATGNCGDNFQALKLLELQPYNMVHPNKVTKIQCVLGLQGEEKAGGHRGLQVVGSFLLYMILLN